MSYILDAIKKAENQRRREEIPTLETIVTQGDTTGRTVPRSLIIVAIIVLIMGMLFWFRQPLLSQVGGMTESSMTWMKNMGADVVSKFAGTDGEAVEDKQQPDPVIPDQSSDVSEEVQVAVTSDNSEQESAPENTVSPGLTEAQITRLKNIRFSVISYSADKNKRFVMDGATILREGDTVLGYPILEIREKSVVLDVDNVEYIVTL